MLFNITFEHQGFMITDPTVDLTGRFAIDPIETYGIKVDDKDQVLPGEEEMKVVYVNGHEVLLNYDGFNAILKGIKDKK